MRLNVTLYVQCLVLFIKLLGYCNATTKSFYNIKLFETLRKKEGQLIAELSVIILQFTSEVFINIEI